MESVSLKTSGQTVRDGVFENKVFASVIRYETGIWFCIGFILVLSICMLFVAAGDWIIINPLDQLDGLVEQYHLSFVHLVMK